MLDSPNPKEPADVKLYKRVENTIGKGKIAFLYLTIDPFLLEDDYYQIEN